MSGNAMGTDESKIDGVLGLEFLKKSIVEIDYEAQTLSLSAHEKYQFKGTGTPVPIKINDGSPMVHLKMTTTAGKTIEEYFESLPHAGSRTADTRLGRGSGERSLA
jgi:hypothetical protein